MRGENFVYEIAYELENDLKSLSESLDKIAITPLIHKIVNVLEELERHSQLYEMKRKEIDNLKVSIKRIEDEAVNKEQERLFYEKDLEKLEESWHVESLELMKTMEKLQEENSNMKTLLEQANKKPKFNSKRFSQQLEIKNVHLKLKETMDKQVEEIKVLKREIAQRCIDFDAMQQQCLNLSNINAEICENHCNNKMMSRRLIEEKVNIEAQILINKKSFQQNHDDVFIDDCLKTDKISQSNVSDINFSWEEVHEYLQDCRRLKSEVNEKEGQLLIYRHSVIEDDEVQGPINKEPVDKMSPSYCQRSGIRQYFQKLFLGIKI